MAPVINNYPSEKKIKFHYIVHCNDSESIDHSGGDEIHLLGKDCNIVSTCIAFVRKVMLFLSLYRVFKSTEPLSFDSHAEAELVSMSLQSNMGEVPL